MTTPLTAAEVRSIIAEEMRRLAEAVVANNKLPQRRPIVEVFRSTFPLPSPSEPMPELKWGCVLWGPDEEGLYEVRNASGTHYWNAGDRWAKVQVQTGLYDREVALKYAPMSPPPDWQRPSRPLPSPESPVLPWGCVLSGNDKDGYEIRSSTNEFYWVAVCGSWVWKKTWWPEVGSYTRARALANPPTSPPPDWKEPAPPLPAKVEGEASKPVASGEPVNPYSHQSDSFALERCITWNKCADAWRSYAQSQSSKLRLSLSQSQHEAEKAKGEIERLKADLATDDGTITSSVLALHEEIDKNEKLRADLARLQSELAGVRGEAEAMRPVVDAANKWQDHFAPVRVTVPASANLELEILRYRASRPLAPAEVKK